MLLISLISTSIAAPSIAVVIEEGSLRPGRTAQAVVAIVDEAGTPHRLPPRVEVEGGVVGEMIPVRPGVWRVPIEPDAEADEVTIVTRVSGTVSRDVQPVTLPPPSAFQIPERIEGSVRDDTVSFVVSARDGPPVDALEVVVAEGSVADMRAHDDGVEVVIALEDQPFPRVVPVGVRDRRGDHRPVWTEIRLRARPRLPLQAEPGSTLRLTVGGRSYGPFVADADGRIDATVNQFPGERVASGLFRDDLGNETRTDLPLVSPSAVTLVAFPAGDALPGRPPPLLHLAAAVQDGSPWGDASPTCRTPSRDLPIRTVGPGAWLAALPALREPEDVRVECTVSGVSAVLKVRLTEGVATALRLRVWPDDLRSDLPFAEVRAVLEDVRGERLLVEGVRINAEHGQVVLEPGGGIVARGEYQGDDAISVGSDTVVAVYDPPRGEGLAHELQLAWSEVPAVEGRIEVYARVLDARRRPLPDVLVVVVVGDAGDEVKTGLDGWATAVLEVRPRSRPVRLEASTEHLVRRQLVVPGSPAQGGPGTATLRDSLTLAISPSRVSGISVEVEPPVLRAGPGAVAFVTVRLEDRSGRAITDEEIEIEATAGTIGSMSRRNDGSLVATYEPEPTQRSGEVQITARTDSLRSSARLIIEPRVVRLAAGPWVGFQGNFGAVSAPIVGADIDVRTPLSVIGDAMLLRAGLAGYGFRSEAPTDVGSEVELRSSVVPMTGAVLFRDDRGPGWAYWGGGGAMLAVHRLEVRFGDDLVSAGSRLLAGPTLIGGGSRRLLGGELCATVRASWLPARQEEVGYTGNLGGLAVGLGYRLVY